MQKNFVKLPFLLLEHFRFEDFHLHVLNLLSARQGRSVLSRLEHGSSKQLALKVVNIRDECAGC